MRDGEIALIGTARRKGAKSTPLLHSSTSVFLAATGKKARTPPHPMQKKVQRCGQSPSIDKTGAS